MIDSNDAAAAPKAALALDSALKRALPPHAARALAEAQARRDASREQPEARREIDGRPGPDPARYGDWENKGIASDF